MGVKENSPSPGHFYNKANIYIVWVPDVAMDGYIMQSVLQDGLGDE